VTGGTLKARKQCLLQFQDKACRRSEFSLCRPPLPAALGRSRKQEGYFVVRDRYSQQLAYVYFDNRVQRLSRSHVTGRRAAMSEPSSSFAWSEKG
jgi:hypothetical protein